MSANHKIRWNLRAGQNSFSRLVENTKRTINNALNSGASYCISWSGGKDSTALVHLVKTVCDDIQIIVQFDDCDWPEKKPYIGRVSERFGWEYHAISPNFSVWEQAKKYQIGYDNLCSQTHDLTRDGFINPLRSKQKEIGCDGVFLGLRAKESKSRALHLYSRGPIYQNKKGGYQCNPLWRWEAVDVFAYLTKNNIPINPCYLKNKFYPPEEIRLSWIFPTPGGRAHGVMEHIRHYYPQIYRRLKEGDGGL